MKGLGLAGVEIGVGYEAQAELRKRVYEVRCKRMDNEV